MSTCEVIDVIQGAERRCNRPTTNLAIITVEVGRNHHTAIIKMCIEHYIVWTATNQKERMENYTKN